MPFKKCCKFDTLIDNWIKIVLVIITEIKYSINILRKDLKSIVFVSTKDKDWLKKLEENNKVLK